MILKESSPSTAEDVNCENQSQTDASVGDGSRALSQGFLPKEGTQGGFTFHSTASQQKRPVTEAVESDNSDLVFEERKLINNSFGGKIDKVRLEFDVIFIATDDRLLLYNRTEDRNHSIQPFSAEMNVVVKDFIIMESPFAEKEVYILVAAQVPQKGLKLSLWTVALNLETDAKELPFAQMTEEIIEGVFMVIGEETDVFIGLRSDESSSLLKVNLTDAERPPIDLEIDPLHCFKSVRLTALQTIENTSQCLLGLFDGVIDDGALSFTQIWDCATGTALMRCAHPLGLQITSSRPELLSVKQHLDGYLFYFFGGSSDDRSHRGPRIVAQNPENGVSITVKRFQNFDEKNGQKARSWFHNGNLIGAILDSSHVRLWNLKNGCYIANLVPPSKCNFSGLNGVFSDDGCLVMIERKNCDIYANFWRCSFH